jgi:predicted nucleic acid-binding protein
MPARRILVDSSFLIALYDKSADEYAETTEIAELYQAQFLVPQVVLTEVIHILKRETGIQGAVQFLDEFSNSRPFLQEITVTDLRRVREIMQQYADVRIDFVDSCILALAERLKITQVCTFDRRDFSILKPKHVRNLEILP